jgi:addiction module RelE/StbE family toxin
VTTVYWTPEARSRLKEIQDYIISQDAAKAAKEVVTTLLARTRQLATAPLSGHKIPDYPDEHIREILQRPYRIIYRVTEQQVEILTVMHYRQLLPPVTVLRAGHKGT